MHRRTVVGAIAGAAVAVLAGSTEERGGRVDGVPATDGRGRDRSGSSERGGGRSVVRSDRNANPAGPDGDRSDVAFDLAPYEISECGLTCREATTTLANVGSADATGVRVTVTLRTGDDPIWEAHEPVGRLDAGASVTRTRRVEVDTSEALAIEKQGYVTAETLIDSDQRTERIVRETEL